MGFNIIFFCFVCNGRVTILEGLLFKLSWNEHDAASAAVLSRASAGSVGEDVAQTPMTETRLILFCLLTLD